MPDDFEYSAQRAWEAKEALMDAFAWSESPEGFDYWNEVHEKLHSLSQGFQHSDEEAGQ